MTYEKIKDKFPKLLDSSMKEHSYMVSCGEGWDKIIFNLCDKLNKYFPKRVVISQIKEKFGAMRFYIDYIDEKLTEKEIKRINQYITKAENKSAITCELCGKPGKMNCDGWIKCLCPKCEDGRKCKR